MKKVLVGALALGLMFTSCNDQGKKAETKEAEKVEVVKTDETVTLEKVEEGSSVQWRAAHLGGAQPRNGQIFAKSASFLVNNGDLSNAKIVMDMNSLTVENFPEGAEETAQLTGHLKNGDFFDVEKFPTSEFELTSMEKAEGDFNSTVTGNLSIMGVTKSVTFAANVTVSADKVSVKSEDFSVDRRDWNLTYHVEGSEGVPADYLIANEIGFTINMTVSK